MGMTITNQSEGVSDRINVVIVLPDSGSSIVVSGNVKSPALPLVNITGSPLTAPGIPGSGSVFWNIQVDPTSGAATVQQSTVADPPAVLSADGVTPQIGHA